MSIFSIMTDLDRVRTIRDAMNLADAHLGYERPPNFKFVFHLSDAEFNQAFLDANIDIADNAKRFVVDYLEMTLEFTKDAAEFSTPPKGVLGNSFTKP